jgi:hypothetical protein
MQFLDVHTSITDPIQSFIIVDKKYGTWVKDDSGSEFPKIQFEGGYVHVCLYVCVYVCMYLCIYVFMYVMMIMVLSFRRFNSKEGMCMCVCIYVCMYVCMYVRMYLCM